MWTKIQTMSPSNLLVIVCFQFLLQYVEAAGGPMAATPTLAAAAKLKPAPHSEGASVRPKPAKVEVVRGTTFYKYDEESYRREMEYQAQNMGAHRSAVPSQTPLIQSSVDEIDYSNAGEHEDYFVADYENMEYFYEDLAPGEKKAEGVDMLQFLEDILEESETAAETVKAEEQMQEMVKEHYSHEVRVDEKMPATHPNPSTEPVSVHLNDDDKPEIELRNDEFQEEEVFQLGQIHKGSQWDFNELTEEEFLNDEFWDGKSDTEIVQLILKYSQVSPEDLQALLFQSEQSAEYSELTPTQNTPDTPINHEPFLDDSQVSYNEDLIDEKLSGVKVSPGVPLNQDENVPLEHEQTTKFVQHNEELLSRNESVDAELKEKQIPADIPHGNITENIPLLHEQTLKEEILTNEVTPEENGSEDEKLESKQVPLDESKQVPLDVAVIHDESLMPVSLNNELIPNSIPATHDQILMPVSLGNELILNSIPASHDETPDYETKIHEQTSEDAVDKHELLGKNLSNVSKPVPGDMSHKQEHPLTDVQQTQEQIPEDEPLKQIPEDVLHMMDELNLELAPEKQESVDVEFRREQIVDEVQEREDVDHEHLSTGHETGGLEFLHEDIEISNEQMSGEVPPVEPSQEQLMEEQILRDISPENNDPLSNEQILGDKPDGTEFFSKDEEISNEEMPGEIPDVQPYQERTHGDLPLGNNEEKQINSEFLKKQLFDEAPLNYKMFLEEMYENGNLSDEPIENQILLLELTMLQFSQGEDVFTTIQKHKQRLEDYHDRSNFKVEPKMEEEGVNHERESRNSEHPYFEPETDFLSRNEVHQDNLEQDKIKENFVPQMDNEKYQELNWVAEEKVFAELEKPYPELELQLESEPSNLSLETGLQYQELHESDQNSKIPKLNNESQVLQDEIDIHFDPTVANQLMLDSQLDQQVDNAFESEIKFLNSELEARLEPQATLDVESFQIKINPEFEMAIATFNAKDSENGFIQNEIKENLQSATENSTSIQSDQSENLFVSEKAGILLNTKNHEEDNPSIKSFQLALDSFETTSNNIHLTKESLSFSKQEAYEQQGYFVTEESSISLTNSPDVLQDMSSNSVSFNLPLDSASILNSPKSSIESIEGDPSLEQLPFSNVVILENSSIPNDSGNFSSDSPNEIDLDYGELLKENQGPSIEQVELFTSHDHVFDNSTDVNDDKHDEDDVNDDKHDEDVNDDKHDEDVNYDKHDEDEYVEWLMQFVPSSIHSWSHGASYSTILGNVSGDRVVLLIIVAISFLVIFAVNQFLVVSSREKPLIARMAQMDKKLFSTTKALEQERVECCQAKLKFENQCEQVQRLNEKCGELEDEVSMIKMEKADAVDKAIKAENMLADSLSQIKVKEDTEDEDHREQLVGLVSELQAQSQAHKTLLDKYESIIKKKEKELKNFRKVNKQLKGDVETANLELDKARKECLECKDIIARHLENDANQKNRFELVQSQLIDKDSSLERMEAELRSLKGRLVTFENEDEIKSRNLDELKEMLIIMEETRVAEENQDSTPLDVKELAKLRLQERENTEDELKKDIFDAKEKLTQVELELCKVKKENECIRVTRDEAARKEEDALNKLDVLTEFFKKKESELLKQLSLHSVGDDGVPADFNSLQEKLLSVSNELDATKESLMIATGELEVQAENHKASSAEQEKKSYENWVAARQAERNLARVEGEMRVLRNRLTIAESRNSELLEAMKVNPVDPKIKIEQVVNNRPDADSESGTEFQPIQIDLPPLPGFAVLSEPNHLPPLPGILSLPKMSLPTIIPADLKDGRLSSVRRRSQMEPSSQYSSCPGSPQTVPNPSSSWYRSASRSPSSSRPQTNSPFPSRAADSHSPYRTQSRSSHRADSRSSYREEIQSSERADALSSHKTDSRSQYIGKSRSPIREDSRSQYMDETSSPQRADSRPRCTGEFRSPYKAQSLSPSRISSEPLCPSGLSNQRLEIQ